MSEALRTAVIPRARARGRSATLAPVPRATLALWLAALAVAATRVLLLPDGPWEQDEAIFAAAVLDYDVPAHRPHPPGFPGWIALGKLALPLVGDPLLGLRILSCAASAATFAGLGWLLRRWVPAGVAAAAAALHAFAPTVWFHAPRAFATTPAVALMVAAVAGWASPRPGWVRLGWVALAWSVLTRPQLLPIAAALGLCGVYFLGRARRLRVLDLALAAGVGVAAAAAAVIDTGSVERLMTAMASHLDANERASRGWPGFGELGLVRGLGGAAAALGWASAALVGLGLLARRSRALGLGAALVVAATLATLLLWHVPTHTRYQVPGVTALTPLVAVAAARLGARLGALVLAVAAALSAWVSAPAVVAAHRHPLPIVAALRSLARPAGDPRPVVYTHGFFSFPRLWVMTGALGRPAFDETNLVRSASTITAPFDYLATSATLPGATVGVTVFDDFPREAWDLSQRRLDREVVVSGAVIVGDGVSRPERDRRGEAFAWLGPRALLWAQPRAEALGLALLVPAELAPQTVKVEVAGAPVMTTELAAGMQVLRVPTGCATLCPVRLDFGRAVTSTADRRELTARLHGAWCEGPDFPVPAHAWSPGLPREAAARGVALTGFYGAERFVRGTRPGAWTGGQARAEFPAGPGTLTVTLANPPPRRSQVTLRTDAETRVVEVDGKPSTHTIAVAGAGGRAWLEIEGDVNVPAAADPSRRDRRALGQTVLEVAYAPR